MQRTTQRKARAPGAHGERSRTVVAIAIVVHAPGAGSPAMQARRPRRARAPTRRGSVQRDRSLLCPAAERGLTSRHAVTAASSALTPGEVKGPHFIGSSADGRTIVSGNQPHLAQE